MKNFILFILVFFLPCELKSAPMNIKNNSYCRNIVLQPQFKWGDHSYTQQGIGSFIRAPNGEVAGLTSAHFFNFSGPQLIEVNWLDIKTKKIITTSIKSWGMPGHEGTYDPLDLRSDYILMTMEGNINSQSALEIDSRSIPDVGERVWFPNKNLQAHCGYNLVEGIISEAKETHLEITLDEEIDLQARSGTPVISQNSGKVIGILTGGDIKGNKTQLFLAPSYGIYKTLLEAREYPLLKDVIGQKK